MIKHFYEELTRYMVIDSDAGVFSTTKNTLQQLKR